MAKRTKNTETVTDNMLPEGFVNAKPEIAGAYFRFEEGATLQGIIIDRFEKPGSDNKNAFIYQIKATRPCASVVIRNPDLEEAEDLPYIAAEVPADTVISIDEKASLKELKTLAADDACEWEIFVKVLARKKLDGGKTFWDCVVGKRRIELPF